MGCGKTWLSTTIDQTLRREAKPKDRVATCYFSNAPATTDTRSVICSLLSQLGMRGKLHPALHALQAELAKTPSVITPTLDQLQGTLLDVLKPDDTEGETIILVDALDEIPFSTFHNQRARITGLLNVLAKSQVPGLRMLMTSRAHGDLLRSLASSQSVWREYLIPDHEVQADIQRYVRAVVENSAEEWNIDQDSQSRLISRLAGPKQTM
jgi:hypothetical protein